MNDNTKRNILGIRIMQRRKQLGIKQSELAERLGVSDNQISNIENGKSYPKLNNFLLICEILNCNPDYLLSGIAKSELADNLIDMIASFSVEEQKTAWILLDSYIHRNTQSDFYKL